MAFPLWLPCSPAPVTTGSTVTLKRCPDRCKPDRQKKGRYLSVLAESHREFELVFLLMPLVGSSFHLSCFYSFFPLSPFVIGIKISKLQFLLAGKEYIFFNTATKSAAKSNILKSPMLIQISCVLESLTGRHSTHSFLKHGDCKNHYQKQAAFSTFAVLFSPLKCTQMLFCL